MSQGHRLAFEKPIYELEELLADQEQLVDDSPQAQEEIRKMRREVTQLKRDIYGNLDAWQTVQVARHPERPQTTEYLSLLFEDFVELRGDRSFGDDRAIRSGFARISGQKVMFIGHQKGRTIKERQQCYFGCAHPEGYRKALQKMKLAAKYNLPVIAFIDTPGAYPGIGAEERGQAQMIAVNLMEMARLPTPIICVVIGEGGSGGALGIGVGDRVSVLEHAYYSVISPEGCAGILWKSSEYAPQAAKALKLTSSYLSELGVVDDVIPEPVGGAHRDHRQMANTLRSYLLRYLKEVRDVSMDTLLNDRYEKFRKMGVFLETSDSQSSE
ncbi:MAG: acetyl-CoA carboxylase carboxyltransferase subunit alpha [Planctomycetota bacterium]|nr:acetyl-CoA carboxylase carboxyltransferase subunit alpha [Planctomycetota bacterium]